MTWIAGANGPFWTEERIQLLRDGHAAGESYTEIARRIGHGVTRNAVCGKSHRLGLSRPLSVIRANNARTKTRESLASNQSLATVVRNLAARKPDKPLPAPKATGEIASTPKPWIERAFGECAYPVTGRGFETQSCCNPTAGATYCKAHRKVMYAKPATDAQRKAAAKARQAKAMRRAA